MDKTNHSVARVQTYTRASILKTERHKVKKYTEIKELTLEIINELVDKILIYQQIKLNGKKFQQIDIYYAGVGIIGVPLTEYELEDAFQQNIKTA